MNPINKSLNIGPTTNWQRRIEIFLFIYLFPASMLSFIKRQVSCRNVSNFSSSKQHSTVLHKKYTWQVVFGASLCSPLYSYLMPTAGSGNLSWFLTVWSFYKGSCVGSQEERSLSSPSLCSYMDCVKFHRAFFQIPKAPFCHPHRVW